MEELLLMLATVVALAGCRSPANTEIDLSDGPILYPTCRVVIEFAPRAPIESEEGASVSALEIGMTRGSGEGGEEIGTGDLVRTGSFTRSGPAELDVDYSLLDLSLLWRGGRRWPEWEVVALVGLGGIRSEFEVSDGTRSGRWDDYRFGPVLGLQASWEPLPSFDLYGRASALSSWDSVSLQGEIGTGYCFVDWARGFLAYRWWRYDFEPENLVANDRTNHFEVTSHGVVLGLELRF